MAGKVFGGGVPTDIEIRALREAYPEAKMEPGQVIPYEAVEDIASCKKDSARWRAITTRWRKLVERETGRVILGVDRGVGFKVLSATEKVELSESKLASSYRAARRSYKVTATVEIAELSDDERSRLSFVQTRTAAVLSSAQIKGRTDFPRIGEDQA